MDRRSFIKSIGAASLLPTLPASSLGIVEASAVHSVSPHTYQWAEMIVRAHNKCNLGLLQRSLQISESAASVLKSRLIENGVVHAHANAYGIHTATKPLYEGAFMNVSDAASRVVNNAAEFLEENLAKENEADTSTDDSVQEGNSEGVEPNNSDAATVPETEAGKEPEDGFTQEHTS